MERNKERRKVVSALEELKECDEEFEEEDDPSVNLSISPLSSLRSLKNSFQLSFSARRSRVRILNGTLHVVSLGFCYTRGDEFFLFAAVTYVYK